MAATQQEAGLPAAALHELPAVRDATLEKGLPPFEADVHMLIDSFCWQVGLQRAHRVGD
jgi:hypothetical protein